MPLSDDVTIPRALSRRTFLAGSATRPSQTASSTNVLDVTIGELFKSWYTLMKSFW